MKSLKLVLLGIGFMAISSAFATIFTQSMRMYLVGDAKLNVKQRIKAVEIHNTNKQIAYLNARLERILNPGTKNEKIVLLKKNSSLIFSPNKIIVKPGTIKYGRLLFTGTKSVQKEQVYVLKLVPASTKINFKKTKTKTQAVINLVVTHDTIVHLIPAKIQYAYTIHRNNHTLTIQNTGTVHFRVFSCTNYNPKTKKCNFHFYSVYPDSSLKLTIPNGKKLHVRIVKRNSLPGTFTPVSKDYQG